MFIINIDWLHLDIRNKRKYYKRDEENKCSFNIVIKENATMFDTIEDVERQTKRLAWKCEIEEVAK